MKVKVRFVDEASDNDSVWDVSRSIADVLNNKY